MRLSFFSLFFLTCLVSAQPGLEQTDWSGGPGVTGPVYSFGDTFLSSDSISWTNPGGLTLLAEWFPATGGFCDSGCLISSIAWVPMGTDWEIEWGEITWSCDQPDCTSIDFQLRTGMEPDSMGEWTDPITESGTFLGDILPDTILLIQYRVNMATADSNLTPTLYDVFISGWYPGAVDDREICLPSTALDVLPNPCFGSAVLLVDLEESQQVSISAFDNCGRLVRDIYSGWLPGGLSPIVVADLETGIYLCRLETGSRSLSRKLVVIR